MTPTQIALAELQLSGEGKAPSEFRILAAGENPTRKGLVVLDEAAATSVMNEFVAGGVELPLDYEHAMALGAPLAERAAAGWFKPEIRDGALWATDVEWTPRGRAAVEAKEFRYTSLWGDMEPTKVGGRAALRLRRLHNVGLVNRPATIGTLPLVASEGIATEIDNMGDTKENGRSPFVVTLGARDESEALEKVTKMRATLSDVASVVGADEEQLGAAVRALKLSADKSNALATELGELKAAAETKERDSLIVRLSEEGKLPPALHDWARTQPIKSLEVFGAHAPKLVSDGGPPKPPSTEVIVLSDELKAALKAQGMSEADYLKTKADMKAAGVEG